MIKAVLFDFGGVLTEGGKAGSIHAIFAQLFGVPAEELRMDDIHVRLRAGEMTTDEFFAELNRRFAGSRVVTEAQFQAQTDIFTKSEPVYALAASLRQHGIKTAILSNVYAMSVDRLKGEGFYEGMDPLILSCEVHMAKPDHQIYELAAERLGVQPEEIIFIDDQQRCLDPAKKFGMHTILAESPEQIVHDTKELLRKENGLTLE